MARRHHSRTQTKRRSAITRYMIAAVVVIAFLSGGIGYLNSAITAVTGGGPLIGSTGNLTDIALGTVAIIVGVSILAARRWWRITHPWAKEILGIGSIQDIYAMSPARFEEYVSFLFKHDGYTCKVVGQTGDQGIDIEMRRHGHNGPERVVAQCKRYSGSVGQPIVREFYGSYANEAVDGYLVTTATFTQPARDWAKTRPIHLVDGADLMRWTERVAAELHHHQGIEQQVLTRA